MRFQTAEGDVDIDGTTLRLTHNPAKASASGSDRVEWDLRALEAVKYVAAASRRGFDSLVIAVHSDDEVGNRSMYHFAFDRGRGRGEPLAAALQSHVSGDRGVDELRKELRDRRDEMRPSRDPDDTLDDAAAPAPPRGFRAKLAAFGAAAMEAAEHQRVSGTFAGVRLDGPILKWSEAGKPRHEEVTGARADVAVGADAQRRITATRIVLIGVFAFAFRKQKGTGYLTIEHPDYYLGVPFPIKQEKDARAFAAKVNAAARS